MGTDDKPLISILMAVYEPRMDWLREQLDSLNSQTYPNLRLYVRDDCSPTVPYEKICALVSSCVTTFPFSIARNEKNLGSNETFERLTAEAKGEYFAYCDQDDVWLPEKLVVLQEALERERAELVCSDMYIIDEYGKTVGDSITKIRRHHVFRSGEGLAAGLLVSNFVTGCTMLVRSQLAKAAVPFCPDMVHDHYLALLAAARGRILTLSDRRLIRYRIHGGNQTGQMVGVDSRESYLTVRVEPLGRRLRWLREHFPEMDAFLDAEIEKRLQWQSAREHRLRHGGNGYMIWKYRGFGPRVSLFELAAPFLTDRVFLKVVNLVRKNKL